MANLGGTFNAEEVAPSEGRGGPLPAGDYFAAIAKSEKRDTRAGTGSYINLEFEVMDGPERGRRFWTMLNLWNQNTETVERAQRELSAICHACGKLRVSDTEELHGIPMLVRLKIKSDKTYGDKNETVSFKPANGDRPEFDKAYGAEMQRRDNVRKVEAAIGAKRGPWA